MIRNSPAAVLLLFASTASTVTGAQFAGSTVLLRQPTANGSYRWEVSAARVSALPPWNPRTGPPPLSLEGAMKTGEEWLTRQTPEIKVFELSFVTLARFPIQDLWYYRLQFDPIVAGRRLSAGANPFTVVILLDGSVVEPQLDTASGPSGGPGVGGPQGPGSGTGRGFGGNFPIMSAPVADAQGVYALGPGITPPKPVTVGKPRYTADGMRAKIQGRVRVECVVQTNGRCTDPKVVQSLDQRYGLDEEAVKATEEFRFTPGLRLGEPVPVRVMIELSFSLSGSLRN